jgi:hypothetical protein
MPDNNLPAFLQPVDLDELVKSGLPTKAVRALPVTDLYFALRNTGEDVRQEVLSLALPEQVQGIFDLDVWENDKLDLVAVREWFHRLSLAMPESRLFVHLQNLDPEIITALLVSELIVLPAGPDFEADAPNRDADWQTPDGRFWVWRRATPIGKDAEVAVRILDLLYKTDADLAMRLLMQVATGLLIEMEEQALQFRESRLADLGFPSLDTAIGIWQPRTGKEQKVTRLEAPEPEGDQSAPRFMAVEVAKRMRFRDRLEKLPPEVQERLQPQLVTLANAALVSEAVPLRNRDAVAATLDVVSGFLDLGLTHPEGEALLPTDLVKLFQLGLGIVAPLSRRARVLAGSHVFDRWGKTLAMLEPGQAEFLHAVSRVHPKFSDPRASEGRPEAFATLEQVRMAADTIAMLEAAAVFFFGEQGLAEKSIAWLEEEGIAPPREERTIRTLLGTFLARILLKQEPSVDPIGRNDLRRLLANLDKLGGFRESMEQLGATSSALGTLLRSESDAWLENLRSANGDPKLVDTVLFRLD